GGGEPLTPPPPTTALGALVAYVSEGNPDNFQPMNINHGLFAPVEEADIDAALRQGAIAGLQGGRRSRREARKAATLARAGRDFSAWLSESGFPPL
ncbi:MAG: FADH(2)-oxidizing methylenetetrahydrofolate--tRNA-(uracil(54)-C(5))-methyltransferase TrmFO, partial [Deltaproteobacteria bacterium]|nr:FADH(2)-oxidizing methylenetetrahydrofolate--tRNA-(uracil(54)-C(5))-methyltransferase TrmFO [Deltaproteobacteria bacterium]